jgi:hypothetical protein
MEYVECELQKPINEISCFISGYDRDAKLVRRGGRRFARFNFEDPVDRSQFAAFWEQDIVSIDDHKPKELALVSPAFEQPETIALMKELAKVRSQLPQLLEKADAAAIDAEVMKVALDQNADLAAVPSMFADHKKKRDAAAEAKIMADTAKRLIERLETQIKDAVRAQRQREADKLKKIVYAEAEAFNRDIRAVYERFNSNALPLMAKVSELEPGTFPRYPEFRTPALAINDGLGLKQLTLHPAIHIGNTGIPFFELRPVKVEGKK